MRQDAGGGGLYLKAEPMAKTSTPQPAPVQHININLDTAAELAGIAHAASPADRLQDLVLRVGSASYGAATAATMQAMAAVFEQEFGPVMWRAGFQAGQRSKKNTFELPAELSAALRRLADTPAQPAPVVNVAAPVVNIANEVIVPSRTVIATPRGDGSVLMVPQ